MKKFLKKSLILMPALFPLYLLKFNVFGIPFNVVEVAVYIVFLMFLYVNFALKEDVEFKDKLKNFFMRKKGFSTIFHNKFKMFFLPMFLFVLASLFGLTVAYLNGTSLVALGILKGWVLMPILYGVMLIFSLKTIEDRRKFMRSYMFSGLILSLWALYQVIAKDFITIDGRASGPFVSANYLAMYIAPVVCGSFIWIWQRIENKLFMDVKKQKTGISAYLKVFLGDSEDEENKDYLYFAFELIVFLASMFALIYSRSYGGIIGVISVLFFYILYEIFFSQYKKYYGSILKKILIILSGLVLIFTAIYSQLGTQKSKDFLQFEKQSSSSVRIQVWRVSLNFIKENPLFGIGLGGFEKSYSENAGKILKTKPYEEDVLHPHNLMLSTYLNIGILGVVAVFWMIISVLLSLKNGVKNSNDKRFSIIIVAMFMVMIVHGLFDQVLWKNDLALLWWSFMALII